MSRRDITVKYRQTVLGAIWIVAGPAVSAGLFTLVFGRVANLPSEGVPYFAFTYAALLGWNLFSETLLGASKSMTTNSPLVTKIYFPRLVLPLSTVASALITTGISLAVMVFLLVVYDIGFSIQMVLLPVWLLLAMVLAMGVGLVLTAIAVSYRDIHYLTPVLVPLLQFLTPVAYSSSAVPNDLRYLYLLNPVATIIEGCRWSLFGHARLSVWAIGYTVVFAFGALTFGLAVFARLEPRFADVI